MANRQKFFKLFLPFFLIFVVGVFLLRPLFIDGFYPMHDDTQVARVHQMAKALSDGMFPVRWVQDLGYGYGYPIFNFYAPLAYYVGGLFVLLGFDALIATKIMIGLPIFLAGIGMYFLSKEFWGKAGGVISAILAMSAPYIAVTIFVRGAIAEYYAYAFIPFVFYSFFKIYQTRKFRFILLATLSLSAVVLSHNLTAMMMAPFLLIFLLATCYSLIRKKKGTQLWMIGLALLCAVFLSGFYWLPALFEMNYTNVSSQVGGGADFRDHFVCLPQLWESQWGYGGSVAGCLDGLSFRLGKLHIALLLACIPLIFLIKEKRQRLALVVGYLFAGLALFLLLPVSQFIWELIGPMAFIQYPWRFLSLLSLSSSFIAGSFLVFTRYLPIKNRSKLMTRFALVVILMGFSYVLYAKLFQPQTTLTVSSEDYIRPDILHYKISKISDEYLPKEFQKPETQAFAPTTPIGEARGVSAKVIYDGTGYKRIQTESGNGGTLSLNLAYFPTWHFSLDSQPLTSQVTVGKYSFSIPKGRHTLEAIFIQTPVEKVANTLSLIGITTLVTGIIISSRRKSF